MHLVTCPKLSVSGPRALAYPPRIRQCFPQVAGQCTNPGTDRHGMDEYRLGRIFGTESPERGPDILLYTYIGNELTTCLPNVTDNV